MILLVMGNRYQQSIYLTSANMVAGTIYGTGAQVSGYFNLRKVNRELQENNANLQNEILNLRSQLSEYKAQLSDTVKTSNYNTRFNYVSAAVVNNSTRHPRNYFTINKGSQDGIKTGMGVVDHNGVTGIVNVTGKHTSRIISLLNQTQHFSVKVKDTDFVGSLTWKGGDATTAYVEEIPRHVVYNIGDTIVTSGFSTTFPENIPVGTILNRVHSGDDSFYTFKIKLASDFRALSTVRVIIDDYKQEMDSLTNYDYKESN